MSNQKEKEKTKLEMINDSLDKEEPEIEIAEYSLLKSIYKSALSQKKVSNASGLQETIVKLFDYFRLFNTLSQDDTVICMETVKSLDDIAIPNEFKDFITPTSVKLIAGNRRLPEMLKPTVLVSNLVEKYSYYEYVQLVDRFRSYFKKDGSSDVCSLASLKKELSLMDVLSISSVSGCVNYDSDPYYPIFLKEFMEYVIGSSFLQDDADAMIKDYCAKLRF